LISAFYQRGMPIEVTFQQGYGLKPGDALRYRGITVGQVQDVALAENLAKILVTIRLRANAKDLARQGSRFWIARPQLDLSGVTGLETVVGANYLSMLPGQGKLQQQFTGLEQPPLVEALEPGGLQVILRTSGKSSLRAGAPVSYRQVVIGTLVNVDLARDASAVEAKIYIKPQYLPLIRENTKFWKTDGARFSAGFAGLSFNVDSVRSLIMGGVNMATPPNPGRRIAQGHEFPLHDAPEQEWLEWTPSLALHPAADIEQVRPHPLPASLHWKYKNFLFLTKQTRRNAWVLPIQNGFLGPADVLTVPKDALPGSTQLTLADTAVALPAASQTADALVVLLVKHDYPPWSAMRSAKAPEDTLVIAGSPASPRFIGASRYQMRDDSPWLVDPALPFTADWHGACVVAVSDGALLGMLLVTDDAVELASIPDFTRSAPEQGSDR
jgi:hypothetical protein